MEETSAPLSSFLFHRKEDIKWKVSLLIWEHIIGRSVWGAPRRACAECSTLKSITFFTLFHFFIPITIYIRRTVYFVAVSVGNVFRHKKHFVTTLPLPSPLLGPHSRSHYFNFHIPSVHISYSAKVKVNVITSGAQCVEHGVKYEASFALSHIKRMSFGPDLWPSGRENAAGTRNVIKEIE